MPQAEGLPSVGPLTLLEKALNSRLCDLHPLPRELWTLYWKHRDKFKVSQMKTEKSSGDMNGLVPLGLASICKPCWNVCACMVLEPRSSVSKRYLVSV